MTKPEGGPDDRRASAATILSYWFGTLDDRASLDRSAEPFRTHHARWYGKSDAIDREIRAAFEDELVRVTARSAAWDAELDRWAGAPRGLLALVVLLDQLPRNMYRGTPGMYAHDALALRTARHAIRAYEGADLPLLQRMFLYVPLMHAEDAAVQREMVGRFEELARAAAQRCPEGAGFFQHALGYARRHAEVIERFGRFPHRNAILGRASSDEEREHLRGPDAGF